MNTKKLLTALLSGAMCLTSFGFGALAEETNEAQVNGTPYVTLEEAVAAADVTGATSAEIELLDNVTLDSSIRFVNLTNVTIKGNDKTITMENEKNHQAKFDDESKKTYANVYSESASQRPTGFVMVNDGTITLNNVNIKNNKTADIYSNPSVRSAYYAYAYATTVVCNDVDVDGGFTVQANAEFDGCTFTASQSSVYPLFVDYEYKHGDYSVSIENCKVAPKATAYGGIKIARRENYTGTTTLSVENSEFVSVPNKTAINADVNVNATLTNNTYNNCEKGTYKSDSGSVTKTNEIISTQTELSADENTTLTINGTQSNELISANGSVSKESTGANTETADWCAYKFTITSNDTINIVKVKVVSENAEKEDEKELPSADKSTSVTVGIAVTGISSLTSIEATTK